MHIRKKYSWQLSDSAVTPESVYLGRRHFLRTCGLGLVAGALLPRLARAATFGFPDSLNPAYKLSGIKLTSYDDITGYNNFYEWGLDKVTQRLTPTAAGRPSRGPLRSEAFAQSPVNMMSTIWQKPWAVPSSATTGTGA